MNQRVPACLLLLGLVFFIGCSPSDEKTAQAGVLKILVLPDRPRAQLEATYAPLLQYLSRKLNWPCELVIPNTYEDALERFHRRSAQLAYLGGATFLKARAKDRAVPLVLRDADLAF